MRRNRNAKIITTLGPETSSEDKISSLFESGADVFRLNFSHDSKEIHTKKMPLKGVNTKANKSSNTPKMC